MIDSLAKLVFVLLLIVVPLQTVRAQEATQIDSLQTLLKKSTADSSRTRLWLGLSQTYQSRYRQVNPHICIRKQKSLFVLHSAESNTKRVAATCRKYGQKALLTESLLSIKYVVPDGDPGTVCLSLRRRAQATYQLIIADNGIDLPENYNPFRSHSLGMTLLYGFSAQLGGELTITNRSCLTICLVFEEQFDALVVNSLTEQATIPA